VDSVVVGGAGGAVCARENIGSIPNTTHIPPVSAFPPREFCNRLIVSPRGSPFFERSDLHTGRSVAALGRVFSKIPGKSPDLPAAAAIRLESPPGVKLISLRIRLVLCLACVPAITLGLGGLLAGWRAMGSVRTEMQSALSVGRQAVANGIDEIVGVKPGSADATTRELRHLVRGRPSQRRPGLAFAGGSRKPAPAVQRDGERRTTCSGGNF
jgi:hypothetical protein